ncbi:MAG: alpha-N-acetylglucosaminidase N-terminal domain-containing protein, partial [Bacteroides sp.]
SLKEAQQVIQRFAGEKLPVQLSLSLDKQEGCNVFETSVQDGVLQIKGSSGVALCRGFYDYVKNQGVGINSWSGNRLDWP